MYDILYLVCNDFPMIFFARYFLQMEQGGLQCGTDNAKNYTTRFNFFCNDGEPESDPQVDIYNSPRGESSLKKTRKKCK